jgi:hypothetical protein
MWAVTPEGRTANLGEVLLNGTRSKLDVTTELQVFALVVTAEPYYAVTQPSDSIVMENVVRPDTAGKVEEIDCCSAASISVSRTRSPSNSTGDPHRERRATGRKPTGTR